jgi:hypothetical protein
MWSAAADIGRVVYFRYHAKTILNYLQVSGRSEEASRIPPANHQNRSAQNGQESSVSDFATSGADGNGVSEIKQEEQIAFSNELIVRNLSEMLNSKLNVGSGILRR